jgi:hypothetical protein
VINSSIYQRVFNTAHYDIKDNGGHFLQGSAVELVNNASPKHHNFDDAAADQALLSINGIKTNKSFQMKYAKNQQELNRRKRLAESNHQGDTTLVVQGINSGQKNIGPYKLMDPCSVRELSPQDMYTIAV